MSNRKKTWWCCAADFGEHEPTCPNYQRGDSEWEEVVRCHQDNKLSIGDAYRLKGVWEARRREDRALIEATRHTAPNGGSGAVEGK